MYVQEDYINKTEGYRIGSSDVYDTGVDNKGELFRAAQRAHGKCLGYVYVDRPNGKPRKIGWMFSKKVRYEDQSAEFYVRETWVTVHKAPPTKTIQYHYAWR